MPTYDYACIACDHRFEQRQSFHDEPIRVCPMCGGETRRVYSPAGIIFKGSGWYITDNRKSGGSTSESTSASSSESKSETKSETKSEAKSETKSESSSESKSDAKVSTGS